MKVLVAVATQHGATREVADMIGATLARRGIPTDILPVQEVAGLDGYDAVVLGSAVYVGNWMKQAREFAEDHREELAARPTWLFSSGPIGDPPKPEAATAVRVADLLEMTGAREHRLFRGRLDMSRLGVVQRIVARAVHAGEGDYRDWDAIQSWATGIADALIAAPAAGSLAR
jgi:menaquinone-dependent protoporphyrinogen oxidase